MPPRTSYYSCRENSKHPEKLALQKEERRAQTSENARQFPPHMSVDCKFYAQHNVCVIMMMVTCCFILMLQICSFISHTQMLIKSSPIPHLMKILIKNLDPANKLFPHNFPFLLKNSSKYIWNFSS